MAKQLVVMTTYNQAAKHAELGDLTASIAAYDRLVNRFLYDDDPEVERHIARGLVNRGNRLRELSRDDEARASYETVIDRYGHRTDRAMSEALSKAYTFSARLLSADELNEATRRINKALGLIAESEYDRALSGAACRFFVSNSVTSNWHMD